MARFNTVWGFRFKTPYEFSIQRQSVRRISPVKMSWFTQWLCVFIPSLKELVEKHQQALSLIEEKERKLADSDAQVTNLADANKQWMMLAKKRKEILKRHGLTDNS